jgi:hypothetical protein
MVRKAKRVSKKVKRSPSPEMPECVGSDCRYVEFDITDIEMQPGSVSTDNQKAQYKKQVRELFSSGGKCGDGCICEKTDKIFRGPTKPRTVERRIKLVSEDSAVDGFNLIGQITYTITVFEGVCGPA